MNKLLAVIRREFIERVRTRAFLFGTFVVPLIAGTFGYLPQVLMKRETGPRVIVVLDQTQDALGNRVVTALGVPQIGTGAAARARFQAVRLPAEGRASALRDSVVALIGLREGPPGAPDGILILDEDAIASGKVVYLGSNVTSFREMNLLERTLEPVLREERLLRRNADQALIEAAGVRLDLESTKVTEGRVTGQSGEASFFLAYIVNFVMYITLLLYGIQVMSAVIEEKSSRIVEVLVSSLSPFQLLLGKVIGVGAVGLVQLGIWAGTGFYVTRALASSSANVASVELAADGTRQSLTASPVSADLVLVVLIFFFLGFFLYSALYAAVGAMCNSQQEAQQANTPITMMIGLGMISMFALINEPSGTMARVLSFIPLFTPIVVPVRYAIAPLSATEVALAAVTLVLGILAVTWIAARIYRVGILSYGKRPSIRELLRWVRST